MMDMVGGASLGGSQFQAASVHSGEETVGHSEAVPQCAARSATTWPGPAETVTAGCLCSRVTTPATSLASPDSGSCSVSDRVPDAAALKPMEKLSRRMESMCSEVPRARSVFGDGVDVVGCDVLSGVSSPLDGSALEGAVGHGPV